MTRKQPVSLDEVAFEVSKLSLRKGDILVLKPDYILKAEYYEQLRERMQPFLPDGVKLLLLGHGLSLTKQRKREP